MRMCGFHMQGMHWSQLTCRQGIIVATRRGQLLIVEPDSHGSREGPGFYTPWFMLLRAYTITRLLIVPLTCDHSPLLWVHRQSPDLRLVPNNCLHTGLGIKVPHLQFAHNSSTHKVQWLARGEQYIQR